MKPACPKALPAFTRLARYAAAFALLALVAFPAVLPGGAEAAKKPTLTFTETALSADEDSVAELTVKLSAVQTEDVEFWIVTSEVTATSDDYIGGRFPATILAGYDFMTMPILIRSDDVEDDSETFTVSIELEEDSPFKAGRDATITIREEPPPGPVQNLTLTADGTSVKVVWDAPAAAGRWEPPRGEVQKYIVRVHVDGEPSDGKAKRRGKNKTMTSFHNLEPGETYKVWVRAENKFGRKGEKVIASITMPE